MSGPKASKAHSVRARLLNLAVKEKIPFELMAHRYAIERFLLRLQHSPYRECFVLKGAMVFIAWGIDLPRQTRDLDLMGLFSEGESVQLVFKQIAEVEVDDDGLEFLPDTVRVEPIRKTSLYAGVRIRLVARLSQMRIPLQVDIGLGDSLVPAPESRRFTALLDGAAPEVLCYSRELVIAEKLEAIIKFSSENTRMKDFFDIWFLFTRFEIDSSLLSEAIKRTFQRRGSPVPETRPLSFTSEFTQSPAKISQWNAFLKKANLTAHAPELPTLGDEIWAFLKPVLLDQPESSLDIKLPTD